MQNMDFVWNYFQYIGLQVDKKTHDVDIQNFSAEKKTYQET